jgi:hypothetical protein
MSVPKASNDKRFTIFRSAAEEAATKAEHDNWDNEGGHLSSSAGRILQMPDWPYPIKLFLRGNTTEHAFATMREAEAFIRRNTPAPASLSKLYDRAPGKS